MRFYDRTGFEWTTVFGVYTPDDASDDRNEHLHGEATR